ncbi:hypothetical protein BU26DRAFT_524092 [Trematosphaeria pertusa]|uniref:Ribosomal RNA-processing protein 8 n=1 Tax=Trematosphaeria pertusa TaxID=390896 RepID=A0A6A6HZ10_9PLEO|nr:uncharacterized protein BU26DRAFT_524092 [Trematosphaeria pertusa]KAF2243139.1 hypothetical protein BU26DRAFT_524092 [Trematosphaeria pertusa]
MKEDNEGSRSTGRDEEKRGKKRKRKGDKAAEEESKSERKSATPEQDAQAGAQEPIAEKTTAKDRGSKRDKKKRKKDFKADHASQPGTSEMEAATEVVDPTLLLPEPKGLTPLQKSMRNKLASARFRHLNETLYTKPSKDSLELFKDDPSMFEDYHRGFAQQVEVWPENPVDGYVSTIITRGKVRSKDPRKDKKWKDKKGRLGPDSPGDSVPTPGKSDIKPLPRNVKGVCTIADLGCGTASLAYRLRTHFKPLNLNFHSFDLSKPSGPSASLVTVADISALPLPDSTVDVAIFCLALMGTNWLDFIDEAYRILRWKGELWVSEIKSRFGRVERRKPPINSIGSLRKADKQTKGKKGGGTDKPEAEGPQDSADELDLAEHVDGAEAKNGTDVSAFVAVLRKHGFLLDAPPERPAAAVDLGNKMFVKMQFVKAAQPTRGKNAKPNSSSASQPKGGLKMGIKGKKFTAVAEEDDGGDEADAKVLKPCLYKIR